MKSIQYYYDLAHQSFHISLERFKRYFPSIFIETIANMTFVITVLIFWDIIYENFPQHKLGFTKEELYIYLAFVEIFFALKQTLVFFNGKFWKTIYNGQLLSMLIRPIHPMWMYLVNGVRLHMILPPIPIVVYLFYQSRELWTVSTLIGGMLIILLAVVMIGLMELTLSTLAFYMTKMNALDEIIDSLLEFTKYPITAFHYGWQLLFVFIFPFMFYATIPSVVTLTSKSIEGYVIVGGCCFFVLWGSLLVFLWNRGLRRYDGFGG